MLPRCFGLSFGLQSRRLSSGRPCDLRVPGRFLPRAGAFYFRGGGSSRLRRSSARRAALARERFASSRLLLRLLGAFAVDDNFLAVYDVSPIAFHFLESRW